MATIRHASLEHSVKSRTAACWRKAQVHAVGELVAHPGHRVHLALAGLPPVLGHLPDDVEDGAREALDHRRGDVLVLEDVLVGEQ
eukprot:6416252-Alexandrium_andersonii.AAC.1